MRETPRGTRTPSSGPPWGRRGGARPALFPQAPAPPTRSSDRSSAAPARVHAAPQATAFRSPAGGHAPRGPAARGTAATAARPPGGGGVRGARGLRVAPGRGALEPAPLAGGARGAALLQLPRRLAQRPAGAGECAGRPRVGEYPSGTGRARGPAASRAGGDCRMRAPVLGLRRRERCAPGAETARTVPALGRARRGAESAESGLVLSGIYKAVKNFHRVAPIPGKQVHGETEEQALKARLDVSRVGCYEVVTECTT